MKKYKLRVSKKIENKIDNIFEYIADDSLENAVEVIISIRNTIRSLVEFPNRFPKIYEKLTNEDLNLRHCFCNSFRIVYIVLDDKVRVVDIRHASREPLEKEDIIKYL